MRKLPTLNMSNANNHYAFALHGGAVAGRYYAYHFNRSRNARRLAEREYGVSVAIVVDELHEQLRNATQLSNGTNR